MRNIIKILVIAVVCVLTFSTLLLGVNIGFNNGYLKGYEQSLHDVKEALAQKGLTFSWENLGNGKYNLFIYVNGNLYSKAITEVHLWLSHFRDGKLLTKEFGAGILTNGGKDWIEQQLGASDGTQEALYCSDSNDATDPALATWTILPSEITTNGLDRQTGSYASTGVGTWTVTVTKTVTGTQSTQLWGLNWIVTDNSDNNLLCADSGPTQKNCVSGDTVQEVWTLSVT